MKTFSDLLAIDTSELLHVTASVRVQGQVTYDFMINGVRTFDIKLPLLSDLVIACNVQHLEEGSGLEIVQVTVNGLEIMPIYLHLSVPQTSFLNIAGRWEFKIPAPFYTWYHNTTGQGWLLDPNK